MTEVRRAEQGVVGVEQSLVAAPVGVECFERSGLFPRVEVRVDVRPAEGVHRLLRVTDQDEGGVLVVERPAHDRPLVRVGVLELVHERHPVAGTQRGGDLIAVPGLERLAETGDEVVVAHQRECPLASIDLCSRPERQCAPCLRTTVRALRRRRQRRPGILDRGGRRIAGFAP